MKKIAIKDLIDRFNRDNELRRLSNETIVYYKQFLGYFLSWLPLSVKWSTQLTRELYEEYQLHNYNKEYEPDFKEFYDELLRQPEREAKNLALIIERYVTGGMDIFAKKTNIEIKNRFITFDISELPQSIQTTGYLVVLDHIMNRLHKNKLEGKSTWIFIDEFHILLANKFSSEYIAKIYKTGRKENAIPTIITQNIRGCNQK